MNTDIINEKRVDEIKKILEEAKVEEIQDFEVQPIYDTEIEVNERRLMLNFLVDVSGSMEAQLPIVNKQFKSFIDQILDGENSAKYKLDLCVTTFGKSTVEVVSSFNKVATYPSVRNIVFKKFEGYTPLGSALLLAAKHCLERRKQYAKIEILPIYRPMIVVISDFADNDNLTAHIDGVKYKQSRMGENYFPVYDKITALLKELQKNKEITVVPLGVMNDSYKKAQLEKLKNNYAYEPSTQKDVEFGDVLARMLKGIYESMYRSLSKKYTSDGMELEPDTDPITESIEDYLANLGISNK